MIYPVILLIHSALRWLVLGSLVAVLASTYSGLLRLRPYSPVDQLLRVVATSIAHTQLLIGIYLYTISPLIRYYWPNRATSGDSPELSFFALIHSSMMLTAVILMTVGSSKAKRQTDAKQQFTTTAVYFTIGLLLILLAIPWPFSPLAARPWFRTF
ncbi:hypothetical protein [uncultured Fibrella sp.]|uniref:hypothetical protein n=1 Tax=uncultured Fibrella sp. TaxID=1284596 RepID=UPI0035CC2E88